MLTVPQRYRRTDRQADGRLMIAIPRFALRTSRGKNVTYAHIRELQRCRSVYCNVPIRIVPVFAAHFSHEP